MDDVDSLLCKSVGRGAKRNILEAVDIDSSDDEDDDDSQFESPN